MTLTAAESLKDMWASIFRRTGGDGAFTRLFDNLDAPQRSTLLSKFRLRGTELPVIGSIEDSSNWLVLTTERLVWSIGGERRELPSDTVCYARADFQQLRHGKLGMRQLLVVSMGNVDMPIELEPGAPLIGVWNIFRNLCARNQNKRKVAGAGSAPSVVS
jgi:hypothetical protein